MSSGHENVFIYPNTTWRYPDGVAENFLANIWVSGQNGMTDLVLTEAYDLSCCVGFFFLFFLFLSFYPAYLHNQIVIRSDINK